MEGGVYAVTGLKGLFILYSCDRLSMPTAPNVPFVLFRMNPGFTTIYFRFDSPFATSSLFVAALFTVLGASFAMDAIVFV